jgi:glutamate synthase (NADPH/NADH) large chain
MRQRRRCRPGNGDQGNVLGRDRAVLQDKNILILSDRASSRTAFRCRRCSRCGGAPHLVRQGLRMQTGLVVETGEAREVHHFCVLAGYGAEAVNPYLALRNAGEIRVREGLPLVPRMFRRTTSRPSAKAS